VPPQLPLTQKWSVALKDAASVSPMTDGRRIFTALTSATVIAWSADDGHELWRQTKNVSVPMAVADGMLFVAANDSIEAVNVIDGTSVWLRSRINPIAPLRVSAGVLFVVTKSELIAVDTKGGDVLWRRSIAGGKLPPGLDDGHVYVGADDGHVLAVDARDGDVAWEESVPEGVAAIGAANGLVYVGTRNGHLYAMDAHNGKSKWNVRLGAMAIGRIHVDDNIVYVATLDNVVRALDRRRGTQRWLSPLRDRPTLGVSIAGHVVFVPGSASQLLMLYDANGRPCGTLDLPGELPLNLMPAITETADGLGIYTVTASLANEWKLTKYATAADPELIPFAKLDSMPGLPYLTDPQLTPTANVLKLLVLGDPPLYPVSEVGWPFVLRDPPLVPITVLPGLQLRPLSPVLPVRGAGGSDRLLALRAKPADVRCYEWL
jgi:outer membrane protein assembly factor BamB